MKRLVAEFGWEALLVVLIVLAALWSSTLSPYFLDPVNLFSSAQFFVIFALMAFGLFPVIVQGEIDISLASTLASRAGSEVRSTASLATPLRGPISWISIWAMTC